MRRLLAASLLLLAAAAPAAAQNVCNLIRQEGTWSAVGPPNNRVINAQGPLLVTCANGEELRADSAVIYEGSHEVQLFRRVDYQDPTRSLTSDNATYNSVTGRLYATGNVVFVDKQKGSTLRGPELEYFRAIPGRPETQMTATGRPHVTVRPKNSGNNASGQNRRRDPMEIDGDRIVSMGDRNMTASGNVLVVDNGTRSTAEEAFYDQVADHVELRRNARVDNEKYQLSGDFIASDLTNGSVSKVVAHTNARLVSDRLTVTGPHLQLFFERDLLQRMISGRLPQPRALGDSTGARPAGDSAAARSAGDSAAATPRRAGAPAAGRPAGDSAAARPARDSAAAVRPPATPADTAAARRASASAVRPAPPRAGLDSTTAAAIRAAKGDSAAAAPAAPLPAAQRSVAVSKGFRMEADSLEAILPDQHLRQVNAVGSAKGESWDTVAVRRVQVDSGGRAGVVRDSARSLTEPPTSLAEKDVLTGDTIIAFFRDSAAADSARTAAGRDSVHLAGRPVTPPRAQGDTAKTEIERLLAIGNAHSLYRMRDSTKTDSVQRPGINYLIGDRIDLTFAKGEVDVARVRGLKQGMYLDPASPADSAAADTSAAARAARARPGAGNAGRAGAASPPRAGSTTTTRAPGSPPAAPPAPTTPVPTTQNPAPTPPRTSPSASRTPSRSEGGEVTTRLAHAEAAGCPLSPVPCPLGVS